MTTAAVPIDEDTAAIDAFAERVFAAGLGALEVDDPSAAPHALRFTLPGSHARVLLDRDTESYMGAFAAFIPASAPRGPS